MPHGLFDDSLYRFAEPEPSYWEATAGLSPVAGTPLDSEERCEVAIIGGGYTGLSAALHLARDFGRDVRVLEAGHIGWGASGRNGGFCCMGGSPLGIATQARRYGIDETRAYWRMQREAVELVRDLGDGEGIDYARQGEGEYVVAEHPTHYADLIAAADAAERVLGHRPEVLSREAFRELGYDAPHQHGALLEAPSFGLHPLRYVYGLAGAAERHGAHLHPASEVISWEKEGNAHVLRTRDGSVRARHVIVTGNGFLAEHLAPQLAGRVLPLQSVIVVTRPLSDDELERHPWTTGNPAINARNVYCYYRLLPDRRLMIGGRGDFTGRADRLDATRQYLKGEIARLWPGWADVDIAYCWRGLVCFSSRLAPTVGRFQDDPSVSFSFAYHGNGVNNATWCGRALAQWLAGGNDPTATVPHHLPAMVRGFAPRLPFPGLRRSYARAGVAVHRLLDWRDDRREARRARRARMSA